jgi:ADP-ribosylarginine hydrolase
MNAKDKVDAIMILHALGDTIGFKNGDWEFNYGNNIDINTLEYVNELIYEFIDLGGVNGINLKKWKVSDDTILHIAVTKALLEYNGKIDETLINVIKKNMKKEVKTMLSEKFNRYIGLVTEKSVTNFTDNFDARKEEYNIYAGGNGAAMRNLSIGIYFYDDEDKMTELSMLSSMITHNNPIGYLSGYTSSLFIYLAMNNIPIKEWPYLLIDKLKSKKIKSYTKNLYENNEEQMYSHYEYIRYWQKYIDTKFDDNKEPIRNKAFSNPMHRIRYFNDNFHKIDEISYQNGLGQIGSSGYLCMIMAFDAVLDCDGKWEKLIVYSMLHSGDSDTIGSIAGGIYGSVYGFGDVPKHMLKYIERKEEIYELSKKISKIKNF